MYNIIHATAILLSLASVASSKKLWSSSFGIPGMNATYDYIIVGGGTAGNAIAARLAEQSNVTVAVVEAGGFYEMDNGNGSVIPGMAFTQATGSSPLQTQPLIDWGFDTVPQAGAADRVLHYARGKTLGGSSARNYMAFHRGTNGSYQMWADEVGDSSYEFSNFLPYFQRSAHFTPANNKLRFPNSTASYNPAAWKNSLGGLVQASYPHYASSIGSWGRVGMEGVGMSSIDGFDSGSLIGSDFCTVSVDPVEQERSSSQSSYLDWAMRETNLQIYTRALVEKVLIHPGNKTAYGIAVNTAGMPFVLTAAKEVILAAGTFQSPQLLMVSGVGPRDALEKYNISVLADLPGVGQNLWDQPLVSTSFRVNIETSSLLLNSAEYAAMATEAYIVNRTGPYTDAGAFVGFEKIPDSYRQNFTNATLAALATFPDDWPELEHIASNSVYGYNEDYDTADPADGYNYATISAILIAPLSRGNVSINSSSAVDAPVINPNWLTHPADVEVVVAGFKRTRDIWAAMSNVTIGAEYFPGRNVSTDAQILKLCRESMIMLYHAAGTCKMGKANDTMAVVDPSARVYGVKGLRVVDASIFPLLPPGHPQATIYALAEKIAEDIKMQI